MESAAQAGRDSALERIFPGPSEMARRMRELDWSKTPLGPVSGWPQSLRTMVSTLLDCAFPIILWWGPELAILYNDEYRPALGPKHPAALGQSGAKVWAEIWDVIAPMLSQVMHEGKATRSRDMLLHIDRGYLEESYFSFSYSPVHGEHGTVAGVFCPVIETTESVIGARRLRTLRDMAAASKRIADEQAAYQALTNVLAANPYDVPFAMIYRVDTDHGHATLAATAGIDGGAPGAPLAVPFEPSSDCAWSLAMVARSGEATVVTGLDSQLPTGAWKVPAHSAMVLPVSLPGQEHPRAILVAAVSPLRALDDSYRTFFGLLAKQIASCIADVEALEQERRRVEALAALDRAKTVFFSNVSHEFRTPLGLILGPLEELLTSGEAVPPRALATLRLAHRNTQRLLKLVNTLLDFSRIEAGRIEASYEATDLRELTIDIASVFRSAFEKAGLGLELDCEPLPEPVYVDRDMWEKIVLNLLSNAFKFTFEGGVRVALHWRGSHVELSVADSGIGIAADDVPRLFQRFYRVTDARGRTHEGSGIGLAFVQELARLHGGAVSVRSELGKGSTFSVTIPTGRAHLPAERIATPRQLPATSIGAVTYVEEALRWLPEEEAPSSRFSDVSEVLARTSSRASGRIVLADDNADMREYLRRLLGQHYTVEAVADGSTALERVRAAPPDLVLADVMMPQLDGFGLLRAIRADERLRSLPIVLLSARAGEEARIEGLRAGADDYVVKPFSARELLARVSSQLKLAQQRREAEQTQRHLSERHRTLLNQAPLGVYCVDADLRICEINPVALPLFGDIPGGAIGRDFDEIMHLLWTRDAADEMVRIFRNTLATGEPFVMPEQEQRRIDRAATEYYEWRVDRITLPDGRYGVVCYFRDISAQVEARLRIAESERLLREADRRKDEFLALLAHELRNPLAPLRTGLEVMRQAGGESESMLRLREMMERQVAQMVRLIDDLLDVARITSGKIVLQRAPVALQELVAHVMEAQRAAIEDGQLECSVDVSQTPCTVDVDATRLSQILSNLVHNAIKFTPPGGRIGVCSEYRAGSVAIRVTDSGIGIAPELLPRIFELFTQGEERIDRARTGLGIGLALARRLTEMHGGRLTGHSAGPGRGATFEITLPVSDTAPVPTQRREAEPA
ncbi:MAG TPA: ATP-binding protein, partial [Polyangiales bacterium]|nr:ATP-binding protein [Polyangiales bacterium]